jgi:hypothetical protein
MHISFVDQARGAWKDGRKLALFFTELLELHKIYLWNKKSSFGGQL